MCFGFFYSKSLTPFLFRCLICLYYWIILSQNIAWCGFIHVFYLIDFHPEYCRHVWFSSMNMKWVSLISMCMRIFNCIYLSVAPFALLFLPFPFHTLNSPFLFTFLAALDSTYLRKQVVCLFYLAQYLQVCSFSENIVILSFLWLHNTQL